MSQINLLVIYANEPLQLRDELSALGLDFEEHQHGNGPVHYACEANHLCLELYPSSESNTATFNRIGLSVADIDSAMTKASSIPAEVKSSPKPSPWGIRAVIQLPSGMKVELTQPNDS